MTDYLDRVEAQLVARAGVLYAPSCIGDAPPRSHAEHLRRSRDAGYRSPADVSVGVATPHDVVSAGTLQSFTGFCSASVGAFIVALLMSLGANPAPSDVTVVRGKGGAVTIGAAGPSGLAALNRRLVVLGIPIRGVGVMARCSATVTPPCRPGETRVLAASGSTTATFGQLVSGSVRGCIRGAARSPALVAAPS